MKHYARHAPAADEIYCALMAERTGENPDNYRGRPFVAELLDFAPSGHRPIVWPVPEVSFPFPQEFGPIPPMPYQPPGGHYSQHPGEY